MRQSEPSPFIAEVCRSAQCLEDRHLGFLRRDPVSQDGDVPAPRDAPFRHGDGSPAASLAKVYLDLVALQDAGRIGNNHDSVGRCHRLRAVGTTGPEVFFMVPENTLLTGRKRPASVRGMCERPLGDFRTSHSPDTDPPTMAN